MLNLAAVEELKYERALSDIKLYLKQSAVGSEKSLLDMDIDDEMMMLTSILGPELDRGLGAEPFKILGGDSNDVIGVTEQTVQ